MRNSSYNPTNSQFFNYPRDSNHQSMPYFVYVITKGSSGETRRLELIESFDHYRDARALARDRRGKPLERGEEIKIIFAADQNEAETRLREVREAPVLKEWEK